MATLWCPECGIEHRSGVTSCPECGSALVEPVTDGDDDEVGVVVYELGDWTTEQRGALEMRLEAEGIEHQWEPPGTADPETSYASGAVWETATDLVVSEADEELVDELLDEVEFPDELAVEDDAGEGEAAWEAMSDLYLAADRLKDDPADLTRAGDLFDAHDAVSQLPAPYGIDDTVWKRVQEASAEVVAAVESEADDDVVATHARKLRDLLFRYV